MTEGPTPYGDDKPMKPEAVQQQTEGFIELLQSDPAKAKEILGSMADLIESTDSTMSEEDFRRMMKEETERIMVFLGAMTDALAAFRQEILSILKP